jgi:hypothetical protein
MRYSRLKWSHSSPTEPVEILSEHDDDGWERRKIEVFADGSVCYASESESVGGSKLSLIPRPPDEEVASEPEFSVVEMTQVDFEVAWNQARRTPAGVV